VICLYEILKNQFTFRTWCLCYMYLTHTLTFILSFIHHIIVSRIVSVSVKSRRLIIDRGHNRERNPIALAVGRNMKRGKCRYCGTCFWTKRERRYCSKRCSFLRWREARNNGCQEYFKNQGRPDPVQLTIR